MSSSKPEDVRDCPIFIGLATPTVLARLLSVKVPKASEMDRRGARYAHSEGHTAIAYTGNEGELVTCGSDGDVRIWKDAEDEDPKSVCVGEWALAVALSDQRLFVSTDSHALQTYTFPSFDKDGVVTRFTAPLTDVALPSSTRSDVLACSSENCEVRLCRNEDGKWSTTVLSHGGPVLAVAMCPLAKYLASSSGDGSYRIWDMADGSLLKEIDGVPKINTFYSAKVIGRPSFEPVTGKLLAYPLKKEIVILDTKTWQQKLTLNNSQINSPLSICTFSPCGNYLAASSTTGQIIVWNVNEKTTMGIKDDPSSKNISSMAWNPKGNGELTFCDASGQLSTVINCYGSANNDDEVEMDENLDLIDIIEREKAENGDNDEYFNDSGDDDENTISLRKLKNQTLGLSEDKNDANSDRRSRSRSRSPSRSRSRNLHVENVPAQPPFQPSSSPADLAHRYMCWNEVGIVRCHTADSSSNIEVEFHDTSMHHSIHLNNHLNHTMASLSTTVLVLACEVPSKIVCIALIGGSKEWSVAMNDMEEVTCVVATDNVVAAATNTRLLRMFTPFGTQLHVISLLGSPVCLSGRKNVLNVIYHASDPGIRDQHLAMDIITIKGTLVKCQRTGIHVALSSGATLRWFGTTDRGSPVTLDSSGMLRLYDIRTEFWVPICNTSDFYKGISDSYFVISVNETTQNASAVLCRGSSYPLTVPRPIATNLQLRLPLCEIDTEKAQHEELLRRKIIFNSVIDDVNQTEIILKLFALACRSEIEHRATEIVELLHDSQIATLAARYASRTGKVHLADKLSNLVETWKRSNKGNEDDINMEEEKSAIEDIPDDEDVLNSSIILEKPKKNSDVIPVKPMPFLKTSQGSRNPFRMSLNNENGSAKTSSNPLSLTDRKLVDDPVSTSPKLTLSKPSPTKRFPEWYAENKEALEAENSALTPSELTKVAVRTFKELRLKLDEPTPKRKHSDDPEDNPKASVASKQSKLGAFAFQKRNV